MVDIQFSQDLFDLGVEVPGVQFVEADDGVGDQIGVFRVAGRLICLDSVDNGVVVLEDIIQNGSFFHEDGLLFKEGHGHVFMDPDRALIGCVFAREDFEEGGFAAAVAGYQGDLVAFFDVESDVAE